MNKNLEQPRKQFSAILYPLCAGLILTLASACGGGGGASSSASKPSLTVEGATVSEGDKDNVEMLFTVTLSEDAPSTVTLSYRTVDGTAELAEGDYIAASDQLTIAEGSRSASVSVYVKGDGDYEADETVTLVVDGVQGVSLEQSSYSGSGTITNDDDADPKGYFTGSATLNGTDYNDVTALVYDKRILLFSPSADAVYDITMATLTIEDYSGTVDVYVAGQINSSATVSVTGQTDESNLSGAFSGGTGFGEGSFTVTFDTNNNNGAGTDYSRIEADPAAKWKGDYHSVDTIGAEMFFQSNGFWGGGANAFPVCTIENPADPLPIPSPQVNIFQVSNDIQKTSANCQYGDTTGYTGFASVINVTATNDGLIFVETNGSYSIYAIMGRP